VLREADMRLLIVEEEMYLSNEIAMNFSDFGYECIEKKNLNVKTAKFDVAILSINFPKKQIENFIKTHHDKPIVLLAPQSKTDKAVEFLELGADTFTGKPVLMKLLIKKVEFYIKYYKQKFALKLKDDTINFLLRTNVPYSHRYRLPVQINSNSSIKSDFVAFDIAKQHNKTIVPISIKKGGKPYRLRGFDFENFIPYITDITNLSSNRKNYYMDYLSKFPVIVSTSGRCNEHNGFECLKIKTPSKEFVPQDILSLDEYVQYVVEKFQENTSDVELARYLKIDRKTLWNKRQKFGLRR